MVGAAAAMEAAVEARPPGKRGRAAARPGDPAADPAGPEAKRRALALAPSASPAPWAVPQPQQQHPASRIYRVSRASGGKDRHSKVYTAKGIRDRRVRLSVATAIQFYDLQDRLGYDQPSKAIEWLIKAAADAIDKLPSLDAAAGFPAHPASAAGKERAAMLPAAAEEEDDRQQQQRTGSGCSSTSETSKGSVLSLSRSDSRVKARERARERSACAARDKDKGSGAAAAATATAASAQAASFTELLTGMAAAEHKQQQQQPPASSWQQQQAVSVSAATADYIGFAQPRKGGHAAPPHAFASPAPHLANIAAAPVAMVSSSPQHFGLGSGAVTVASGGDAHPHQHAEMTHFSFLQDHFNPVHAAPAPAGEYNLNFSMSSGLVGVNSRGTLQSNTQPHISGHHHHQQQHQLQRLSTTLEAPNIPFFFSPAAAAVTTPTTAETQFAAAFQLWNGGFHHHADMKEKGKN